MKQTKIKCELYKFTLKLYKQLNSNYVYKKKGNQLKYGN